MPHASPTYPPPADAEWAAEPANDTEPSAVSGPVRGRDVPADTHAERRTRRPTTRRELGTAWLVLSGLLLLAAIPLAIELTRPRLFNLHEARAHGTALETWQRQDGFRDADSSIETWVPVYLGRLRYDQPPGSVWVHVLALPQQANPPDSASARATLRWVGVFMALLLVAAVFWAGHSIGGTMTGLLGALAAMSMPTFLFFGRIAAPEMMTASWAAVAMATALWAMRPLRRNPSLIRQFIGWLLCGLTMGMATLTGGGSVVPVVLIPIVVIALICPHRIGHTLGLVAATAIAALTVTPWAIYVHEASPDGWQLWLNPVANQPASALFAGYGASVLWRLLAGVALLGVWAVWLLPTVLQPYSSSSGKARQRMLIGWSWLVSCAALVILLPGPTRPSVFVVLVAPAALALGQVMRQFHDLSAEGRHATFWTAGKWVTIGLTALLSLMLPGWAYYGDGRPDAWGLLQSEHGPLFATMGIWFWGGTALVLCLLTLLGARFAMTNHPGRAFGAWAAWTLTAAALLAIPLARGTTLNTPATPPLGDAPSSEIDRVS